MNKLNNSTTEKRIAIVATDNKRGELIQWSYFNKDVLTQHQLIACGETGIVLEGTLNTIVNKLFTADTGGYQQLANLIENGKIDMLFYFAEPASSVEKDLDLKNLLVVAAKHNVVVACNKVTTQMVMASGFLRPEQPATRKTSRGILNKTISFFSRLAAKPSMTAV